MDLLEEEYFQGDIVNKSLDEFVNKVKSEYGKSII